MCTVSPVVEWDLPKAVGLYGAPINGSCSVTAYPRPHVIVITPYGCDSQHKSFPIGRYTTKALFTISNVTKNCEQIRCLITTFHELHTTELLIVGKCLFSFPRQFLNISYFQRMCYVEVKEGKLNQ